MLGIHRAVEPIPLLFPGRRFAAAGNVSARTRYARCCARTCALRRRFAQFPHGHRATSTGVDAAGGYRMAIPYFAGSTKAGKTLPCTRAAFLFRAETLEFRRSQADVRLTEWHGTDLTHMVRCSHTAYTGL